MRAGAAPPAPRGDIALLLEGAQLFPRELDYVLRAAQVCQQHGFAIEAALLGAHGHKFATDATARARFLPFTPPAEPAKNDVRPAQ